MKRLGRTGALVAAVGLLITIGFGFAAQSASAWHGVLGVTTTCNDGTSLSDWTLSEPGDNVWNPTHASMIVKDEHGGVFHVGQEIPFGTTATVHDVATPSTVYVKVGWVGFTDKWEDTATSTEIHGCHVTTTTTQPTTTTTEKQTTTTTAVVTTTTAPTTTSTLPVTTTTEHVTTTVPQTTTTQPVTTTTEHVTTTVPQTTTTLPVTTTTEHVTTTVPKTTTTLPVTTTSEVTTTSGPTTTSTVLDTTSTTSREVTTVPQATVPCKEKGTGYAVTTDCKPPVTTVTSHGPLPTTGSNTGFLIGAGVTTIVLGLVLVLIAAARKT